MLFRAANKFRPFSSSKAKVLLETKVIHQSVSSSIQNIVSLYYGLQKSLFIALLAKALKTGAQFCFGGIFVLFFYFVVYFVEKVSALPGKV